MQVLCEIKLPAYLAADNPFEVVSRPERCAGCGGADCLQRHGTYSRYIGEARRKVARFLCALCGLTVSLLPRCVLPYRPRLVAEVARYFAADDTARPDLPAADTLRRYWREWCGHCPVLQRTGWPPVRPLARDPRGYWRHLRAAGGVAAAQAQLVARYGLALLRRYACHRVPACA